MADDSREQLASGLTAHLADHLKQPVRVDRLARLAGGSSNETWAFDLVVADAVVPLVLRRCFVAGPLEVRVDVEFALHQALHRLGLPVAKPWTCVIEASPLRSPFMIVARAPGSDVRKLLAKSGAAPDRPPMGTHLVSVLTRIHAIDFRSELGTIMSAPAGNFARFEVERWAPDIESAAETSPLLLAALRWLRANAPPNATACLVHGDFKANNLLFADGHCSAVIDWELAHVGDPIEDLAWTLLWDTQYDLVNGLLAPQEFLASYALAAGKPVDPRRLFFWRVFSLIKLAAIFLRGLRTQTNDAAVRPMLVQLVRALPQLEYQLATLLLSALEEEGVPA